MKEELITFETAKLAKEKGFNLNIKNSYVETIKHTLELGRGGDCTFPYISPRVLENYSLDEWNIEIALAPTQSLLQKWLREVHNISVEVTSLFWEKGEKEFEWNIYLEGNEGFGSFPIFKTYEEALEIGLQESLKLIKIKC